jgi:uncharacterized protein YndB with AHSA1/START domain
MANLSSSTVINQPVEKVFTFLVNAANHKIWQPMLLDAKVSPEGPVTLGSTYIYTTDVMGRKMETKLQVSQFEPNHIWAFKTVGVPTSVESIYVFDAEGNGTKLTISMDVPAGAYPAAAEGMIKQQMQKSLEEQGKQLKQILEK